MCTCKQLRAVNKKVESYGTRKLRLLPDSHRPSELHSAYALRCSTNTTTSVLKYMTPLTF
jgi:hypothetical protein